MGGEVTSMPNRSRTMVLACIATLVLVSQVPALARAAELRVEPVQVIVTTGHANSTDTSVLAQNASAMTLYSNKSGDRNFHESYDVKSLDDFKKYFTVHQSHYQLPVEFKDEKEGSGNVVHKKVVRIKDELTTPYSPLYYYYNQFITQKQAIHPASVAATGWLEFYFLSESTNGTFLLSFGDFTHRHLFNASTGGQYGEAHGINFGIQPGLGTMGSSFFVSTSWSGTRTPLDNVTYQPNQWYHVHFSFTYNVSWSIKIDNQTVYTSPAWGINATMARFDCISMYTQTATHASGHGTHVFYIDALGIGYNMAAHNTNVPSMTFNAAYQAYVDVHSINNINDHVVNASLVAYFKFSLGTRGREFSAYKLVIQGRFTQPVQSGRLSFYNRQDLVYDVQDASFNTYLASLVDEYEFSKTKNNTANITTYVGQNGEFTLKIDAQSNANNFEYVVRLMVFEFQWGLGGGDLAAVILVVAGFLIFFLIYKINQRGGYRGGGSSRRRSSKR